MEINEEQYSQKKFNTPEEELVFLREKIAQTEARTHEAGAERSVEEIAKEEVVSYKSQVRESVLDDDMLATEEDYESIELDLEPEEHDEKMSELLAFVHEHGIRNTIELVDRMNNPHIEDDFHRLLVQFLSSGNTIEGLKTKTDLWKSLNMTLYEVSLPDFEQDGREKGLKELISSMEQFYAGMMSVSFGSERGNDYFTIEIALPHIGEQISFYVAVPNHKKELFEKQILSIFSEAKIVIHNDDYNVFNSDGESVSSYAKLKYSPIYPIKLYSAFDYDPLHILINSFSKINREGEGAALQLVFRPTGQEYAKSYKRVLDKIRKGKKTKDAVNELTLMGDLKEFGKTFAVSFLNKPNEEERTGPPIVDEIASNVIQEKIATPIVTANIRLVASAGTQNRAEEILDELESAFNQYENANANKITFVRQKKGKLSQTIKQFTFREFNRTNKMPLSLAEITTMIHFPLPGGAKATPQLKKAKAGSAPVPNDLSSTGVLLGENTFRNHTTQVRITRADRLRHFYIIGQTGTGKSHIMKQMIIQDIENGDGVCMIDPHGSDIVDVLATVPKERYEDVIYFDPSYTARPMGLNMLEYDARSPEQKTFVVNEMFSIFDKLFDMHNTGGPMFEQYFRNSTLLAIDDPTSGSTLLDVSRVLSDQAFREMKLSRCTNPVVVEFWRNIAGKAGGEASLANIVPYITSKFDVFLANDIMRPIVAQARSSFNFREVMDSKKILLVNLAKGRLGDMNASLLGLILVGKILMAALSRVDSHGSELPDFYLHLDEFQNITTNSIATILSEARKYKLGLTVAHQFIAQLDESIRDAVFGNVGSMAVFRVGAEDAEVLQKQFEPVFSANDLMNIDNQNAYLKMLVNGRPAQPFNIATLAGKQGNFEQVEKLKEVSYLTYGRAREEIEQAISQRYNKVI